MNRLDGANCADLPGFVVDKYFDCNATTEPLRKMAALAICNNCVVVEACRDQALNGPRRGRGVIGGVTVAEIRRARRWRLYEQGVTDNAPGVQRPSWLAMTEGAQTVEQGRIEADPDEPTEAR